MRIIPKRLYPPAAVFNFNNPIVLSYKTMNEIAAKLLRWYPKHARLLPWRKDTDPYHVWVAEIMLQQTRVETVIPYYQRWMERFPSLASLACVSQQEVLKIWEGLGYYSRARNLYRAAKMVMQVYQGKIPDTVDGLLRLPGIGRSTAGAIASISFNHDEPILDGNVKRVLARLMNFEKPVNEPASQKELWQMAIALLPKGRAGIFNQALMELGETICLPRNPLCPQCPLKKSCASFEKGLQDQRPVRKVKPKIPHYEVAAAVIRRNGKYLLARRPEGKLLAGMWEFPGGKLEAGETLPDGLKRELFEEPNIHVEVQDCIGIYHHGYTHFTVRVHAYECRITAGRLQPQENQALSWLSPEEFESYPMGKVDRLIARQVARRAGVSV